MLLLLLQWVPGACLAGSETGGALREPRSSHAKQVQPTSVITLLIIWHGVGIHTCHGDYGGEVML